MNLLDAFYWPWVLIAAPPLLAIVWWDWLRGSRRAPIRFSDASGLIEAAGGGSFALKSRIVLPILRSLAILAVVVAIARPRRADELAKVTTEGVALELVLDRSSSMAANDLPSMEDRRLQTRLDAVKNVVSAFINGDGAEMKGREGDLIGLTVFAAYPDTVCPLTRDHQHLIRALREIEIPTTRSEDGTAIGDALLLGIERLRNIGRKASDDQDFNIKSRAIILLTDGEQNAGDHTPLEAAQAAKALDIKIYTIGAAPRYREVDMGLFGRRRQSVNIDEDTLTTISDMTGGRFFRATSAESLANIYRVIDELERTKIDEQRYYLFEELAYRWVPIGQFTLPPVLLIAIIALGLDVLLSNTRLRMAT